MRRPFRRGTLKKVEFRAPALPDPELSPLLADVETIGVLSGTNIEEVRGVDIEKVMGRLTDATAKAVGRNLPESRVITQDEIRLHFNEVFFDSTWLADEENLAALRDDMEIGAVIYVVLESFQAQMTPVSPESLRTGAHAGHEHLGRSGTFPDQSGDRPILDPAAPAQQQLAADAGEPAWRRGQRRASVAVRPCGAAEAVPAARGSSADAGGPGTSTSPGNEPSLPQAPYRTQKGGWPETGHPPFSSRLIFAR